jgi:hypothetical protein
MQNYAIFLSQHNKNGIKIPQNTKPLAILDNKSLILPMIGIKVD